MNELEAIVEAFEKTQKLGDTAFLATIVNSKGSTYRRPGARMLITGKGHIVGTIASSCLENDVLEHTRKGMRSLEPIVVTYDIAVDEDITWIGLGCNGVVQILIERLNVDSLLNPIAFFSECLSDREIAVIATVFAVEGAVNVKIGDRLIFPSDGSITTDIPEQTFTTILVKDAQTALYNQQSTVKKYRLASGSVEVFIEVIKPPTPLVIFGGSPDAIPVAKFAKALGWHVTIVDCNASKATHERFSMADKVILSNRELVQKQVCIEKNSAIVVMTHNYQDDREILKMLLPSPVAYLGILGSKARTEHLLEDLRTEEVIYLTEVQRRLYSPIGMNIGADTPEEIALAIIAEIKAVLTNCQGGSLKNYNGSIHQQHQVSDIKVEGFHRNYANA
ncbi:MAG: XdhC family protein [Cyanomargarita calcarea GSE-NOS-MK-12-04C]|jgi:xanthine/CO dehydrogenase XdhC/CoxF family maturation factor|uniref:XdhC family protein n=1 Tax=Cyanomargarita calcarea GSE-NOS-MK-12-04C TaxID=2839659 RepID=A0A951QN11_9CYAN|nr:XdhC family protein [Cyanomargarita calcarea GSE-NOS-MK-12-04C]